MKIKSQGRRELGELLRMAGGTPDLTPKTSKHMSRNSELQRGAPWLTKLGKEQSNKAKK